MERGDLFETDVKGDLGVVYDCHVWHLGDVLRWVLWMVVVMVMMVGEGVEELSFLEWQEQCS